MWNVKSKRVPEEGEPLQETDKKNKRQPMQPKAKRVESKPNTEPEHQASINEAKALQAPTVNKAEEEVYHMEKEDWENKNAEVGEKKPPQSFHFLFFFFS